MLLRFVGQAAWVTCLFKDAEMTFFYHFLLGPLRLIRSWPNPSVGLSSKLAVMACLILLLQIKHRGALNSKQFTHLSAVSKQSFIMERRHKLL